MPNPIPETWRSAVRKTLKRGDARQIALTRRAWHEWQAQFPKFNFDYELFDVLANALDDPALAGNQVTGMKDPGTTYEFIFRHENQPVYAKINLFPDNTVVIVYSAHRPTKGDTL